MAKLPDPELDPSIRKRMQAMLDTLKYPLELAVDFAVTAQPQPQPSIPQPSPKPKPWP